jgi:hypothetical protein
VGIVEGRVSLPVGVVRCEEGVGAIMVLHRRRAGEQVRCRHSSIAGEFLVFHRLDLVFRCDCVGGGSGVGVEDRV